MTETHERRRRRPQRPVVYLTLVLVGAAVALGSAWTAAHAAEPAPVASIR